MLDDFSSLVEHVVGSLPYGHNVFLYGNLTVLSDVVTWIVMRCPERHFQCYWSVTKSDLIRDVEGQNPAQYVNPEGRNAFLGTAAVATGTNLTTVGTVFIFNPDDVCELQQVAGRANREGTFDMVTVYACFTKGVSKTSIKTQVPSLFDIQECRRRALAQACLQPSGTATSPDCGVCDVCDEGLLATLPQACSESVTSSIDWHAVRGIVGEAEAYSNSVFGN